MRHFHATPDVVALQPAPTQAEWSTPPSADPKAAARTGVQSHVGRGRPVSLSRSVAHTCPLVLGQFGPVDGVHLPEATSQGELHGSFVGTRLGPLVATSALGAVFGFGSAVIRMR